jgi:cystathionine gamma-synthase
MRKKSARRPLDPRALSVATRAIHGRQLFAHQAPVAPSIVQTSTYRFSDSGDALRYAHGDPDVYVYTRYHNPTVRAAEERLALVLESEKSLLVASGMAAISSALLAAVRTGESIVSTPALYGGTYRFFRDILPRHGVRVRYANSAHLDRLESLIDSTTRVVYFETPTNPTLQIVDIASLVAAVRKAERRLRRKILIMVDNTFATSLNQHPFRFGVDVVIESATKYLGGHSDVIAGVIAGSTEFISQAHTQMKYYGGCADPFAAFLLLRSLKTFELRVARQNANALALASKLERDPHILRVLYPGLPSHPDHETARRQMVDAGGLGYGGMITVEVKGGLRKAQQVTDELQVAVNAMSLGGAETLVSIPVYSSHVNMSPRELRRHGVTPGMIRISVGVEGIADLTRDFAAALAGNS